MRRGKRGPYNAARRNRPPGPGCAGGTTMRPADSLTGRGLLALALAAAGTLPALAATVREPVLKQIRVPHHYYYREMYLPQATSGPSSADWSPDGTELVLSMQGSLWIHKIGSGETRMITNGPGYDYQPDWSPDGKRIVYASYRDDQVDLWVYDLASGESQPFARDGAVNVDPRFSPDGARLAWVSTAHEGRFHVFASDYGPGRPAAPARISEDGDGGLPRYYYGRFDQALSPVWSPAGDELLFVSNRGHIWGSGGFWRAAARPGAEPREIRYEETTWRARPDWSPDGRRIAYASYLGGQWHQIWLMTAEGGDPFPLTYGEFDATNPRWSPDGGRLVYVSNEHGNTELRIVAVPGGATTRVDLGTLRRAGDWGRLRISLTESGAGLAIPARVSVMGPDGRFFAPNDAWRHADEMFVRGESRFEYGYFHARGSAEVAVPAGRVRVEVSRGPEYSVATATLEVKAGTTATHRVTLKRLADMPARGWRGGDLHVHMNYGGAYRADPKTLLFQADAEGLNVVENLIVNKEQRIPDIRYFSAAPDPVSRPDLLILHAQEFHTSYWGHTALLGLRDHFLLPGYASYANTAVASPWPTNAEVFDLAHAQGAVTGYVHPFDTKPDPFDTKEPLSYEMPVDVALGKMDYLEVMGFSDHLITSEIWYRMLNCGFKVPAGAGTDAMTNYASLRGPLGLVRAYVQTGNRFDHDAYLAGLRDGRTFVTNAPLLEFSVAGEGPGGTVRRAAGTHALEARVSVTSPVPLDHVEIVRDGKVVATLPVRGNRTTAAGTVPITFDRSGWVVLRAWADSPKWPILDLYPFGSTSPVYVQVGETPIRSAEDASYFVRWVDRLIESVSARTDWNSAAERDRTLAQLGEAKRIYQERGGKP
jgi:TolB protein